MPATVAKSIEEIKSPIEDELKEFEVKFKKLMVSSVPLLDRITHYIVKRKGKQMRPMFVFLSAKLCGGVTESTYRAGALIELLHTATLVHDDVVDNSFQRRGIFSINALWKNKIAVLVGDYFLSKGLLLSIDNQDFELLKIVSNAVKSMSEGELLQIEKARSMDIKEEIYFEIIRNKTASLIASSCACGASSAGADKETIEKMRLFGEKIGIAFQIKDDLFDLGTDDVGKPLGIDIKEKKMTLPLIYALNNASFFEKRKIINLVKNYGHNNKKVQEVIDFVIHSGGIEYSKKAMNKYQEEALEILSTFPDSKSKSGLEQLISYTTERKK